MAAQRRRAATGAGIQAMAAHPRGHGERLAADGQSVSLRRMPHVDVARADANRVAMRVEPYEAGVAALAPRHQRVAAAGLPVKPIAPQLLPG